MGSTATSLLVRSGDPDAIRQAIEEIIPCRLEPTAAEDARRLIAVLPAGNGWTLLLDTELLVDERGGCVNPWGDSLSRHQLAVQQRFWLAGK